MLCISANTSIFRYTSKPFAGQNKKVFDFPRINILMKLNQCMVYKKVWLQKQNPLWLLTIYTVNI